MTTAFPPPAAEVLCRRRFFAVHRAGRYLVAELLAPHRVLSNSAHVGGQREDLRFLVNHQSCEATADRERHGLIAAAGPVAWHHRVCGELGLPPDETAVMGTAANMACAAHRAAAFEDLRVDAFTTAGVAGNAARAGDPAAWTETGEGWRRVSPPPGTINTILLIGCPVTPAAQTRAVVTMTEAKSAALSDLAVPSRYSAAIATGTGTDQFCLAAPLDPGRRPRDSTGPHVKLGELVGVAVKESVREALRWQNGLEASCTRSVFHALGRFGLTEARALERLSELLPASRYELLDANRKAVFFEPGVGAAAYALAAVLDRVACGTIPEGASHEAVRCQAACMACALACRPESWPAFRSALPEAPADPLDLVLRAIADGWRAKWA